MRECTYCKSPIVKTKSNPEQKCAYKLCDGFGFNRISIYKIKIFFIR